MIKRLKEAVGIGTPDNYASKAMNLLGNALILDRAKWGLNDEVWWDPEDRTPLRGAEVYEPVMQRLYYATEDFRRWLRGAVARFVKFPILLISTVLILGGFALIAMFGPSVPNDEAIDDTYQEQPTEAKNGGLFSGLFSGPSPQEMSDEALIAAVKQMKADGKTQSTLTKDDEAILNEISRRNLL